MGHPTFWTFKSHKKTHPNQQMGKYWLNNIILSWYRLTRRFVIVFFRRLGVRYGFTFGAVVMMTFGFGFLFDDVGMTTGFAFLIDRLVPWYKIAFGVFTAPVEGPASFAFPLHDISVATIFGAGHPGGYGHSIFAVRVVGTTQKFAETPVFN